MMDGTEIKISVIGLGRAGLPLAAVIADNGYNIVGIDLDRKKCELINSGINPLPEEPGLDDLIRKHGGSSIFASPEYDSASSCNVYIVIVPLLINNGVLEIKPLESALRRIGKLLKKNDLVVIETTIPPLTTEKYALSLLEEESGLRLGDFYLAHSPERIMSGKCIVRLKEFPKIIGGVNKESGICAYKIYSKFIPNLNLVSSAKVAEFIKNMEGCYRDVNIALANELYKIADELEVDFFESRKYANHKYCDVHLPSTGVGGHCIPVYPWFLINEMEKRGKNGHVRLLKTSRKINDEMIEYWASKIIDKCLKIDKPLKEVKICIKGITYRKDIKDINHSRNLVLVKFLLDKGLNVTVFDKTFKKEEVQNFGLQWGDPNESDVIFDPFELKFE